MSGPKVSSYELERRRREEEARRLEEERRRIEEMKRREELRRQEEERKRKASLHSIGELQKGFLQWRQQLRAVKENANYMKDFQNVQSQLLEIEETLGRIEDGLGPYSQIALDSVLKQEMKLKKLKEQIAPAIQQLQKQNEAWKTEVAGKLDQEIDDLFHKEHPSIEQKQQEAMDEQQEAQELKKNAENIIEEVKAYISEIEGEPVLTEEFQHALTVLQNQSLLKNYQGMITYYGMHGRHLQDSFENFKTKRAQFLEQFTTMRIQYESACELAGIQPNEFTQSSQQNMDTMQWMQDEIIRVQAQLLENREKAIINDAIQEVMEDLGYTILGSKETVRRNGSQIQEKVFSYGEGTAVNVIEANGQITMEVVGVDTSDRIPDDAESEYMEEEMTSFCSTFKEAEERLKAKGIVLKNRIQMMPPSKAYAQILNINDYDLQTKNISMIQSRSKKQKSGKEQSTQRMNLN